MQLRIGAGQVFDQSALVEKGGGVGIAATEGAIRLLRLAPVAGGIDELGEPPRRFGVEDVACLLEGAEPVTGLSAA